MHSINIKGDPDVLQGDLEISHRVGALLRQWRRSLRFSIEELADRCQGRISARHIRRIEAGEVSPTLLTVECLRKALGIAATQLWLPLSLEEENIPLYAARCLPQPPFLAVDFHPGKTTPRYAMQEDSAQYAVLLQEGLGLLGRGTILHLSPAAPVAPGALVLGFREDGAAGLLRWKFGPDAEAISQQAMKVHKVVWIQPV